MVHRFVCLSTEVVVADLECCNLQSSKLPEIFIGLRRTSFSHPRLYVQLCIIHPAKNTLLEYGP